MTWSFPIGRLLGSQLRIHATFFLLLLWVGVTAYGAGGTYAALVNVSYVLLLFACVIAHEYGHALMARRFGIRTPDITLLPIGGMARLERMPEKPGREILVALAGPAVNVVIFLALWLWVGLSPRTPLSGGMSFATLPEQIAMLNLILALFNMIPAFPMDGGRVLRATLSIFMARVTATKVASLVGQGVAIVGAAYGLWTGQLILVLIAVFIFMAARAENNDVALRDRLKGMVARDVMITEYTPLRPGDGIEVARLTLQRSGHAALPVKDFASGRVVGVISEQALDDANSDETVEGVMQRQIPAVPPETPLARTLRLVGSAPMVAVVSKDGTMTGFLTQARVGEVLQAATERQR